MSSINGNVENACTRCGVCCRASTPALHVADLELVDAGLSSSSLVTLRAGEPVDDNVSGQVTLLHDEMVKVKWTREGACTHYDIKKGGCAIYAFRPVECRALFCRDTAPLKAIYREGRVTRADILGNMPNLLRLAAEHESVCSCRELWEAVQGQIREKGGGFRAIKEMTDFDRRFRQHVVAARPECERVIEFLLGRPLEQILPLLRRYAKESHSSG